MGTLFKFKSKACGDLIMLHADGTRMLEILMGHSMAQGILTVQQLPDAIARLEAAVADDDARCEAQRKGQADDDERPLPTVRLSQRAAPMLKMLRKSLREEADLVWGV